ncbi:MAG: metal ABC transporter ATP-binding protein [Candidatus Latescibacter sp.]|nr:metal ABC transporter ATP-binding protein [Candidatus Latescibacter sp.]
MMNSIPVIELKNVWFSYNGETVFRSCEAATVLKDITFKVERNDFLAVIGPNGGGKTTLLKLILGMLQPKKGTVRVFGEDPAKRFHRSREAAIVHRLGYVTQDTSYNRDFPITVIDAALMGRLGHPKKLWRYTKTDREIAQHALETVDMGAFRSRRIGSLSGGQRQRVFIARTLASEPDILLLDEPTASIDIEGQQKIYDILKKLNENMTILVVSHDLNILLGIAKSVAHVNTTLFVHNAPIMSSEMLGKLTGISLEHFCPVELLGEQADRQLHRSGEEYTP